MAEVVSPFDAAMQHWLPVRVYYEDTDFTGMVYHANYLRFFERGRSEFLRDAGVSHQSLLALPEPAAFTLTNVQVDYKRAARIGIKGAKVLFEQTARRGDEVIAEALITAIMIHADGRPRRPLPHVGDQLRPYIFKS